LEIVSDGQQPCRSAARFCRHIARLSFRLRELGHPGTDQLPIGVLNCQRDDVESNCSGERDRGEGKPHFPPPVLTTLPSAPS
jgi:hypothetical protein